MIKNIDKKNHMHTLLKLLLDFKKIQIHYLTIIQSWYDHYSTTKQVNPIVICYFRIHYEVKVKVSIKDTWC